MRESATLLSWPTAAHLTVAITSCGTYGSARRVRCGKTRRARSVRRYQRGVLGILLASLW